MKNAILNLKIYQFLFFAHAKLVSKGKVFNVIIFKTSLFG